MTRISVPSLPKKFHQSNLRRELAAGVDPARIMQDAGFTPDPWQCSVLRSKASRQLLLCARQVGKSTTVAALALHDALYLQSALILLVSPTLRQSQELFRKVNELLALLPYQINLVHDTSLFLEFANGSRIVALPGNELTIRGYSRVTRLIIDEASRVDDDLYRAVRPMLAVSSGKLTALSTPWGKRGWFYEEWIAAHSWQRTRVTALECPRVTTSFLDEERQALGAEFYAQEYLCEFAESGIQVFDRDLIDAAFDPSVKPLFMTEGVQ